MAKKRPFTIIENLWIHSSYAYIWVFKFVCVVAFVFLFCANVIMCRLKEIS